MKRLPFDNNSPGVIQRRDAFPWEGDDRVDVSAWVTAQSCPRRMKSVPDENNPAYNTWIHLAMASLLSWRWPKRTFKGCNSWYTSCLSFLKNLNLQSLYSYRLCREVCEPCVGMSQVCCKGDHCTESKLPPKPGVRTGNSRQNAWIQHGCTRRCHERFSR